MLPSEIQLRGRAKPHRKQLKRKPAKCPFWIVKQVLLKLRTNQITWHENPARLILVWLTPFETHYINLDILLPHILIKAKILKLLSANLANKWLPILEQLRPNKFMHQLSLLWLHMKFYKSPLICISWLKTKIGFDCCWECHRFHYPDPCKPRHLRQAWNHNLKGIIFYFQTESPESMRSLPSTKDAVWKPLLKILNNHPWQNKNTKDTVTTESLKHAKNALSKRFPLLKPLLQELSFKHKDWQLDTFLMRFARMDEISLIHQSIKLPAKEECCLHCNKYNHRTYFCDTNKCLLQKLRQRGCINLRKDNLNGQYAQRSPFHLLIHTLIPEPVFQAYEKNFISFFPGNRSQHTKCS